MSLVSALTGTFKNLIFFTIIILVHELGHFTIGILLKWKVDKIIIYPYGGCTKFSESLNKSLLSEFLILIAGPIFQILFYFLISKYLSYSDYILFKKYNGIILFFNLLPIYPLDGGKLFNIFLSIFIPFLTSFCLSIYFSLFVFLCALLIYKTPTYYLILFFLLVKVYDEFKNRNIYYNKFLLERYLYDFKFKDTKIINNVNMFFKGKKHIIRKDNGYSYEKEYLASYFSENKYR